MPLRAMKKAPGAPAPSAVLSLLSLLDFPQQALEGVVVLFLVPEDLREQVSGSEVSLLRGECNNLLVHRDRLLLSFLIRGQHLFERRPDGDGIWLRRWRATQVEETFGNGFGVLHLLDADLLEFILDGEMLDALPHDMLPHVLERNLEFTANRVIQHAK
jgi:hypothetical protein